MPDQNNINLKELSSRFKRQFKRRPTMYQVARYAKISPPQLTNIIAGRRKASPALLKRIQEGFRRYMPNDAH